MANNFAHFGRSMRQLSETLERSTVEMIKTGGRTALRELADNTPVDTSQAVSSWIIAINGPAVNTRSPIVPGRRGSTAGESRLAVIAIGIQDINQGVRNADDKVWITNNQPYVPELNRNHSQQTGFVERSGDIALNAMRRRKLLRRSL